MAKQSVTITLPDGKIITLESGHLAKQAGGAVVSALPRTSGPERPALNVHRACAAACALLGHAEPCAIAAAVREAAVDDAVAAQWVAVAVHRLRRVALIAAFLTQRPQVAAVRVFRLQVNRVFFAPAGQCVANAAALNVLCVHGVSRSGKPGPNPTEYGPLIGNVRRLLNLRRRPLF